MSVVAITGATGGIGRAVALRFARDGYDVACFDLDSAAVAAQALCDQLAALGRRAAYLALDVTDPASVGRAFDAANERLGSLRVLVNNAGIAVRIPAIDLAADDWTRVLATNLSGPFFCSQTFARPLIAGGAEGCIVNVASVFGLTGGPNRAAYSSAKAGLVNLTRVLAYEWSPHRIRVNAVAPTFVRTPLTEKLLEAGLDVQNRAFGERLATPEDVAEAIFFLAGPGAAMINGHTLPVDGGWLAW
jgi:NAD(P)-dependent dehydrogenase (short-subunit alcohol dehydrogenase family)